LKAELRIITLPQHETDILEKDKSKKKDMQHPGHTKQNNDCVIDNPPCLVDNSSDAKKENRKR